MVLQKNKLLCIRNTIWNKKNLCNKEKETEMRNKLVKSKVIIHLCFPICFTKWKLGKNKILNMLVVLVCRKDLKPFLYLWQNVCLGSWRVQQSEVDPCIQGRLLGVQEDPRLGKVSANILTQHKTNKQADENDFLGGISVSGASVSLSLLTGKGF